MTTILITGNTYPVKDQLRELGSKWDPTNKGWKVPAEKAAEAQSLVAKAPNTTRATNSRRARPGRRTGCSCGSQEDASGNLIPSPNNCSQCEFDA